MAIGNVEAYEAAIARRVAQSRARKAAEKSLAWFRADETRVHVTDYLQRRSARSEFCYKLLESFREWGTLTEGQEAAVRRMMAQDAERAAARAAENAALAETARHVGTVGARGVFSGLTVKAVPSFETNYGTLFVHVMHDEAGNVVVYKGSQKLASPGDVLSVKATVKEHGSRDGVPQTVLSRPQVLSHRQSTEAAA